MAKEPDQTRWVGIRPTDPSEDIPVDAVRPADTISHLQMVKEPYYDMIAELNKDCSVMYSNALAAVPAGELWVITHISLKNNTTLCDLWIHVFQGAVIRNIACKMSAGVAYLFDWNGLLVLEEDDYIQGSYEYGSAADDVYLFAHGYKIGVY